MNVKVIEIYRWQTPGDLLNHHVLGVAETGMFYLSGAEGKNAIAVPGNIAFLLFANRSKLDNKALANFIQYFEPILKSTDFSSLIEAERAYQDYFSKLKFSNQ